MEQQGGRADRTSGDGASKVERGASVESMLASVSDLAPTEQAQVFETIHRHLSDQLGEQVE